MDESDPRTALDALVANSGESYAALSRLLGRNEAYLQQFVRRGSPRLLAERDRRMLAAYFGVDERVLGASGPDVLPPPLVRIARMDAAASAGPGAIAEDRITGSEAIDPQLLRRLGVRAADLSIITATGDSMMPTIADGDEMLIDTSDHKVGERGAVFVVRTGGLLAVKRVARAGGALSVTSDNPAYAPLDGADVTIIGRVVRLTRSLL